MATCLFCEIAAGRQPAAVVYADELVTAFLDIRPLFPGHVLVAPKEHIAVLADLPVPDVGPYFEQVQRIAVAVQSAMGAQGSFVAVNNVVSQSVPHLHTHVVPRSKGDGLRGFFWPRTKYGSPEEADDVAARIRAVL
ncbi:histidine triad (HIT) family protein [Hamadaea flava]|uniref:HIT family protein n=1 Tax=Hamadaea flava TaxID=1742688 RepID=A0ABV8LRR8_9ACTN|nr:HIT family protein [Hamadaea flava]MCP2321766.1 histidine triad (HIT) family protein [Hamadaea flava]